MDRQGNTPDGVIIRVSLVMNLGVETGTLMLADPGALGNRGTTSTLFFKDGRDEHRFPILFSIYYTISRRPTSDLKCFDLTEEGSFLIKSRPPAGPSRRNLKRKRISFMSDKQKLRNRVS